MLQDIAAQTGAAVWATASMVFFIVVYAVVVAGIFRSDRAEMDAKARLALDDEPAPATGDGNPQK